MTDTAELIAEVKRESDHNDCGPEWAARRSLLQRVATTLAAQAQEIERKSGLLGDCSKALNYMQECERTAIKRAEAAEARVRELLSKRPVAFRVLKPNGDWYVTQDEHEASDIADGKDYQGLYARGGQ